MGSIKEGYLIYAQGSASLRNECKPAEIIQQHTQDQNLNDQTSRDALKI